MTHLEALKNFRRRVVPPAGFVSDGCTCSPDTAANGADLKPACRYHDHEYFVGGSEKDRKLADLDFLYNLKVSGCPWYQRRFYYHRVRFWGVSHFNYWVEFQPPTVRHRLALLWLRYTEGGPDA